MPRPSALFAALDLVRHPILATAMRRDPLPGGILEVIKIAAGSDETLAAAADATGRTETEVRDAAIFYIEQIMFASRGDPYRTLGVPPDADTAVVGENVRWLMKWLHPDRSGSEESQAQARKVLDAWTEVKSPDRRRTHAKRRAVLRQRPRRSPARRIPALNGMGRFVQQSRTLSWRTYAATGLVAVIALTGLIQLMS